MMFSLVWGVKRNTLRSESIMSSRLYTRTLSQSIDQQLLSPRTIITTWPTLFSRAVSGFRHGLQLHQTSGADRRHVRQSGAELQSTVARRPSGPRPAVRPQSRTCLPIRRPARSTVRFLWTRSVLLSGPEDEPRRTGRHSPLLVVRSPARPSAVQDTGAWSVRTRQGNGTHPRSVAGLFDGRYASKSQYG